MLRKHTQSVDEVRIASVTGSDAPIDAHGRAEDVLESLHETREDNKIASISAALRMATHTMKQPLAATESNPVLGGACHSRDYWLLDEPADG